VDDVKAGEQNFYTTNKLSCLMEATGELHILPVPSGFLEESPEAQAW